jgi:outer membrane autotransporter protein
MHLDYGPLAGFYFDASARAGRTRADFRTDDIVYNNWQARFSSSVLYYGLHAGAGLAGSLAETTALDFSARFLWTHQAGDDLTVFQDRVCFEDTDSLRFRMGGRLTQGLGEHLSAYLGAFAEHELSGSGRATVNGVKLAEPELRGTSGLGEIGLALIPSSKLPMNIDLGAQGHIGKRRGISGSV